MKAGRVFAVLMLAASLWGAASTPAIALGQTYGPYTVVGTISGYSESDQLLSHSIRGYRIPISSGYIGTGYPVSVVSASIGKVALASAGSAGLEWLAPSSSWRSYVATTTTTGYGWVYDTHSTTKYTPSFPYPAVGRVGLFGGEWSPVYGTIGGIGVNVTYAGTFTNGIWRGERKTNPGAGMNTDSWHDWASGGVISQHQRTVFAILWDQDDARWEWTVRTSSRLRADGYGYADYLSKVTTGTATTVWPAVSGLSHQQLVTYQQMRVPSTSGGAFGYLRTSGPDEVDRDAEADHRIAGICVETFDALEAAALYSGAGDILETDDIDPPSDDLDDYVSQDDTSTIPGVPPALANFFRTKAAQVMDLVESLRDWFWPLVVIGGVE